MERHSHEQACELRSRAAAGEPRAVQTEQQVQRPSGGESVCIQGVRGAHISVWPREMCPVMPQTIAEPDDMGPFATLSLGQ